MSRRNWKWNAAERNEQVAHHIGKESMPDKRKMANLDYGRTYSAGGEG
jgi:hypothetical protein